MLSTMSKIEDTNRIVHEIQQTSESTLKWGGVAVGVLYIVLILCIIPTAVMPRYVHRGHIRLIIGEVRRAR